MKKKRLKAPKSVVSWESLCIPIPKIDGDYEELWVGNNSNQSAKLKYGDKEIDLPPHSFKHISLA